MPINHNSNEGYFLLSGNEDADKESPIAIGRFGSNSRHSMFTIVCVSSFALNVICIVYIIFVFPINTKYVLWKGDKQVWSPAQDVVPYENQLFASFLQRSKYSGPPSPEVDKAWYDLYSKYVMSAIPETQAKLLSNKTMRVPGPGHPRYVVGLDVFHQLHCLDYLRQSLYPDHYGHHDHSGIIAPPEGPDDEPFDHLDHCINNVRQALMCNADLTPIVVQWDAGTHRNWARLDVVHTCKDWSAVHQWAVDAHIGVLLNWTEHVGFPEDN